MIVTVTPNPSIDRTVTLATPLTRGAVHRVSSVTTEPGGKGVNVARALTLAGVDAVALLPASGTDPLVAALQASGVPFRCVPITAPVRTNIAVTEMDGTTTKINEPGARLDAAALDALTRSVVGSAEHASWVVMSGSLPPGMPDSWYADVVAQLAPYGCKVAIDTSDGPLAALVDGFDRGRTRPDQAQRRGARRSHRLLRRKRWRPRSLRAIPSQSCRRPSELVNRGVGAVLATLGAAGAVLVNQTGSWLATPPPIVPRSTVGAGDSVAGRLPARRRRRGRAAATTADGRRLRQRRGRTARIRPAHARRGRPQCRSGDSISPTSPTLTNPASS